VVRRLLIILGALQLLQGLAIIVAPRDFYDAVANFGPYEPHLLRDTATINLAIGVALLVAAQRAAWRQPVLALAGLQFGLHAINHLLDVGDAESDFVGWFDVVTLAALSGLFLFLFVRSTEDPVP
jgi:hypothetical protein